MPVGAGVGGHPHVIAVGSKGEKSDARRLTLPMAQTHVSLSRSTTTAYLRSS